MKIRLRYLVDLNPSVPGSVRAAAGKEFTFLPMEAIGEDWSLDLSRVRPLEELLSGYSYFEDGDIALAKVTPCFENGKAAILHSLSSGSGFGTTEVTVIRPTPEVNTRYLLYVLSEDAFKQRGTAEMTGAGGLKRVPDRFILNYEVDLPPRAIQDARVLYLDRETAEIDAFIADQEELIALLTERRAATITHAVTKGLDPTVPMKDSGVEWLIGEFPRHWELSRLGSLLVETKTIVGDRWSDHLLLSLTLQGVIPRDMKNIVGKLPSDFTTYQSVRQGELVFCLFDVEETPRTVGLATQNGMVTGAYTVYRTRNSSRVTAEFVALVYQAYDQFKLLRPYYAGLRNTIRKHDFKAIPIALPPLDEQIEIVDSVAKDLSVVDATIADAREAIELSRERRAALISAAVTGKIDVREHPSAVKGVA